MSKVESSLLNLTSSSGMITARIRRTPLRHRKQIAKQSSRGQFSASTILQRATTTISEFASKPTASHQEAKRQKWRGLHNRRNLFLSLSLSVSLSIYVCLCLPPSLSVCFSVFLSVCVCPVQGPDAEVALPIAPGPTSMSRTSMSKLASPSPTATSW